MCLGNGELRLAHRLLRKPWALLLRGGTASQPLCRHSTLAVQASARATRKVWKHLALMTVVVTGEWGWGGSDSNDQAGNSCECSPPEVAPSGHTAGPGSRFSLNSSWLTRRSNGKGEIKMKDYIGTARKNSSKVVLKRQVENKGFVASYLSGMWTLLPTRDVTVC